MSTLRDGIRMLARSYGPRHGDKAYEQCENGHPPPPTRWVKPEGSDIGIAANDPCPACGGRIFHYPTSEMMRRLARIEIKAALFPRRLYSYEGRYGEGPRRMQWDWRGRTIRKPRPVSEPRP